MKTQHQVSAPATVTGIAASFCSGVVVRTALRTFLAATAPVNPIISFIGITALSMTVEDRVANHIAKETQNIIDCVKESWNKSEDSE